MNSGGSAGDGDAKKMMKRTKIFHGEFTAKLNNYLMKSGLRRSSKNNIIYIKEKIGSGRAMM